MRLGPVVAIGATLTLGACSASSSPSSTADAGLEAGGTSDAGADTSGSCEPFCGPAGDSGPAQGDDAAPDGPLSCDQLKAKVDSLQMTARACNPQLPTQCNGVTDGVCCAISVSTGHEADVNNLEQAVMTYKQQCNPTCVGIMCQNAPSGMCIPLQGSQGLCQ